MSSLVIYNAKIYVEKGHFEEALIAVEGVIRSVGSNEEILSQAPERGGLGAVRQRTLQGRSPALPAHWAGTRPQARPG